VQAGLRRHNYGGIEKDYGDGIEVLDGQISQ
jgi:hypothetical protein